MLTLARTSLGMLGLALVAPMGVEAQVAPSSLSSGYQPLSPAPSPSVAATSMGLDGTAMPAPVMAEAPHKHKGRTICAKCAAKLQASGAMPPGKIVGCEHSRNGVCSACQAALNMPGQFVMAGGQPTMMAGGRPGQAPGRAVASSSPNPMGQPGYDPSMVEPSPVGVVQANFSQGGPMGMPAAGMAPQQAMAPGRAMVESNAGRDPYQAKSGPFPRPHIIGHLLGFTGIGSERADEKARKKAESHAMISYDSDAPAPVEELPASMVFSKKRR